MALLFSDEILSSVEEELHSASQSVQIISAYCKESSFKQLNGFVDDGVKNRRLLLRFRMNDIQSGSTDFSVAELALKEGWKVYIRFDLHAKTYIFDNKRCIVGSANATNSGLGIGKTGNMEVATLIDFEAEDARKIDKLYNDAIIVSPSLLEKMKTQLDEHKNSSSLKQNSWDSSIIAMFKPKIETLFSYEFPDSGLLVEGEYYSFIDEFFTGDITSIKEALRMSNAYIWLIQSLKESNGCLYFGSLTAMLHNVLISDPKPYRKDVKQMLSNLLELVLKLDMEEIIIDRPNYSQRIRLR